MKTTSTLCSFRKLIIEGALRCFLLFCTINVNRIIGQPNPVSRRFAPVKFAITFASQVVGSCPAFQAIVPSTKYSGIVCTIATMANASPRLMEDSEASAAHAISSDAAMTAPNVRNATA